MRKYNHYQALLILLFFIILSYLFSRGYFNFFFPIMIAMLLMIVFFKETNRILCWMMMAFFCGNLMHFYMDHFLNNSINIPIFRVLANELLWLVPIVFTILVIKKFRRTLSDFLYVPKGNGDFFFIIVIAFLLLFLIAVFVSSNFKQVSSLFVFVVLHASLQELIWRGLFLTHVIKISNPHFGIFITGILFGLNTTLFGYSLEILIINTVLGILLGYVTIHFKSILPSIFAHVVVLLMFYLSGWLNIPI